MTRWIGWSGPATPTAAPPARLRRRRRPDLQHRQRSGGYLIAVSYSYDALDRSISEQPTGKAANTVTWDANSRMLTFTDNAGT
ncbi:MAG: hypothetical protein ACR2P2_08770 [Nakamurella sp.]